MRSKGIAFVLVFVLLLASGCYSAITPTSPNASADGTGQTTIRTQPTELSSSPTVPSQPTDGSPAPQFPSPDMAEAYRIAPKEYFPFIWDGYRWPYIQSGNDFSKLTLGALYWLHRTTDELTLIAVGPVAVYNSTQDHLFYILESEPGRIYRSDYAGQEQTVVFQADEKIGRFSYWGANENGKLYIVIGSKQVLEYDLAEKTACVIMEQYQIDDALVFGDEETGQPYLEWFGKTSDEDEAKIYRYDFLTGENLTIP